MTEEMKRKGEVSLLVKLARMANRERIKWPRIHPLRERNRGRVDAYMDAARYLDGRLISPSFRRRFGIAKRAA